MVQDVVDRKGDLHHRDIGDPPDELGGASPGDDAVVAVVQVVLNDLHPLLEIPGKDIQPEVRVVLGGLLHGGPHAFVGGNAQNMDRRAVHANTSFPGYCNTTRCACRYRIDLFQIKTDFRKLSLLADKCFKLKPIRRPGGVGAPRKGWYDVFSREGRDLEDGKAADHCG